MDLIESIAAKQIEVDEIDWALWCNRLEQTLGQACDSAPVNYFFRDALRLNPKLHCATSLFAHRLQIPATQSPESCMTMLLRIEES